MNESSRLSCWAVVVVVLPVAGGPSCWRSAMAPWRRSVRRRRGAEGNIGFCGILYFPRSLAERRSSAGAERDTLVLVLRG